MLLQVRLHALARPFLAPRPPQEAAPAGFFYEGYNRDRFPKIAGYFTNVSGEGN
jgi:hypothetical protein